ncbi:AAA family ATPase [Azospirillum endophyticum]
MNGKSSAQVERFIVLTGGPGSGKTTLIDALQRAGHARSQEAGRGIIQDQAAIGGHALPWRDPIAFAELMLSWEMRSYRQAQDHPGPVFFDRGLPDIVGYLRMLGLPVPPHLVKAVDLCRYHRPVFIAPPWPEIFTQDRERKQTLDEAERTYEAMVAAYVDHGYQLVELPRVPVEQRVRFVIDRMSPQTTAT